MCLELTNHIVLRHTYCSLSRFPYFFIIVRTRNSEGYIDLFVIPWSNNIDQIKIVVAYDDNPNLTAAIIKLK